MWRRQSRAPSRPADGGLAGFVAPRANAEGETASQAANDADGARRPNGAHVMVNPHMDERLDERLRLRNELRRLQGMDLSAIETLLLQQRDEQRGSALECTYDATAAARTSHSQDSGSSSLSSGSTHSISCLAAQWARKLFVQGTMERLQRLAVENARLEKELEEYKSPALHASRRSTSGNERTDIASPAGEAALRAQLDAQQRRNAALERENVALRQENNSLTHHLQDAERKLQSELRIKEVLLDMKAKLDAEAASARLERVDSVASSRERSALYASPHHSSITKQPRQNGFVN
ncbi:hypothetical protein FVE85_9282 [Porphyridium purpureum]|uniref:Uncharacterized protein n=1 Tax=Porphyridium purpureum TaxID=35688 RepID=A0A5J4YPX0_PORPP|nr:hypothetical protein FVE85_9282 [Porphyridium purpureum]|eukprot:POR0046..scf222_8